MDRRPDDSRPPTRRAFLAAATAAGGLLLAGCGSDPSDTTTTVEQGPVDVEIRNELSGDVTGSVVVEGDGEPVSEAFDLPSGAERTYDDLIPAADEGGTTYRVSVTTDGHGSVQDELSVGRDSGLVRVLVVIEPEGTRVDPLYRVVT
jgi:hypothetical protein